MLTSIHAWIYPDVQPVPEQTSSSFFYRLYPFENELVPITLQQATLGSSILVNYSSQSTREDDIQEMLIQALGLSVDMKGALQCIESDSTIRHILSGVVGIRPYQSPTVFEALIKTIIQQQVSYRAANMLTKKLVLSIGSKSFLDDSIFYGFPTSNDIVGYGIKGLEELGFGFKAKYVHGVADMVSQDSLALEELKQKQHDEVITLLKPLHGIGLWTIQTLAIAGLGDFNIFPIGDLGIRNLLGRLYNNGQRMSTKDVEHTVKRWGNQWPLVLYLLMCADVLDLIGKEGRQQIHKRHSGI